MNGFIICAVLNLQEDSGGRAMRTTYNGAIIIDSGDETKYPGRTANGLFLEDRGNGVFTSAIETPHDFISSAQRDLKLIASKPIGKDLLDLIVKRNQGIGTKKKHDGSGKTVTIVNGWGTLTDRKFNTGAAGPALTDDRKFSVQKRFGGQPLAFPGAGTSVIVRYLPSLDYTFVVKLRTPSYVALAHELIHAYHFLSGTMSSDMSRDVVLDRFRADIIEEALTVGAGTYADTRISENAIRREHNLPTRQFYRAPGDCIVRARERSNAVI